MLVTVNEARSEDTSISRERRQEKAGCGAPDLGFGFVLVSIGGKVSGKRGRNGGLPSSLPRCPLPIILHLFYASHSFTSEAGREQGTIESNLDET